MTLECRLGNAESISGYIEGQITRASEPDAEGCLLVTAYDVTSHRREAFGFHQIVEGALQGIVVHRGGVFLYMNDTLARMVGRKDRAELMAQQTIAQFIHPDDVEFVADNIRGRLANKPGVPNDYEFRLIHKDGSAVWVDCRATVVDWEGGPAVLAALFDITGRKEAEERAEQSAELFARVFHTSPDLIALSRVSDGTIVDANEAFVRTYGTSAEEIIGRKSTELGIWADMEDRDYFMTTLARDGIIKGFEVDGLTKEKERHRLSLTSVIFEFGGELLLLTIIRDITEQYQQREELRASKEAAELANRSKSEFLANMSHELRTPLNAILGFSEAIKAEMFGRIDERRYVEYADDIYSSGDHLLHIINDILDLSKIEAGKLELEISRVSVREIFEQCMRIVNERAAFAGILIRVDEPAKRRIALEADQRRIKQALINLLSNAIKFTPEGGEIVLGARITDEGGCEIFVSDTGAGMTAEEIAKAILPFGQADASLSRSDEGAGLGLPLVRAFVEMMGGSMEIDSKKGTGTTVTLAFSPAHTTLR